MDIALMGKSPSIRFRWNFGTIRGEYHKEQLYYGSKFQPNRTVGLFAQVSVRRLLNFNTRVFGVVRIQGFISLLLYL
jgi:hypothetical protein